MSDDFAPDWLHHTHDKRVWRCIQYLYLHGFIETREYKAAIERWREEFGAARVDSLDRPTSRKDDRK